MARALQVADERAGTLPLRDAMALELHAELPDTVTVDVIDRLSQRLARVALASMGAALTVLSRDV